MVVMPSSRIRFDKGHKALCPLSLRATAQARDAAIAAHTAAKRERDQAVQDLEEIEGTFGEEDLRDVGNWSQMFSTGQSSF